MAAIEKEESITQALTEYVRKLEMKNCESQFESDNDEDDESTQEPAAKLPKIDIADTYKKVELFATDTGPKIYNVKGSNVTPSIIPTNLPESFKFLPIFGRPRNNESLEDFYTGKIRDFVGNALNDDEYKKLTNLCSPANLRTGHEVQFLTKFPTQFPVSSSCDGLSEKTELGENLCIVKKLKLRLSKDTNNMYSRTLKYRGIRMIPYSLDDSKSYKVSFQPLQPGRDILYRVRVYRPFHYALKERLNTRHSIFTNDILLLGRQSLMELRDRIVCANDASMRVDMSQDPEQIPTSSAREVFPSAFLFINNVFYVDERAGCKDLSAPVRGWAQARGLGTFPRLSMGTRLDAINVRLGHPEVMVHQGSCEHLFVFSEVRLLGAGDPCRAGLYPQHTAVGPNQTLYCTTCAEFAAKWVVVGCARVPFDPAFFCDTCLRKYLYRDGQKVCDFKAYNYRGNEINVLKPLL